MISKRNSHKKAAKPATALPFAANPDFSTFGKKTPTEEYLARLRAAGVTKAQPAPERTGGVEITGNYTRGFIPVDPAREAP